mgnify:CR=1 FL=1
MKYLTVFLLLVSNTVWADQKGRFQIVHITTERLGTPAILKIDTWTGTTWTLNSAQFSADESTFIWVPMYDWPDEDWKAYMKSKGKKNPVKEEQQ